MADSTDIKNELREMGSNLADCSRAMPHHLPDKYFEHLAEQMSYVAKTEDSFKTDTAMPYSVPDNYFDSLPQQLLEKTAQKPAKRKRFGNIWPNIRWAAAAMLIIAVGIGSYQTIMPQSLNIEAELSEIPETSISGYIQDNIDDFDAELLAESVSSIETDLTEVNEDAIESYLDAAVWQ